jgi:hypothetical protein
MRNGDARGTLKLIVHDQAKIVDGRIASAPLRDMGETRPE